MCLISHRVLHPVDRLQHALKHHRSVTASRGSSSGSPSAECALPSTTTPCPVALGPRTWRRRPETEQGQTSPMGKVGKQILGIGGPYGLLGSWGSHPRLIEPEGPLGQHAGAGPQEWHSACWSLHPWLFGARAHRAKSLLMDQGFWGPFPGCLSRSSRLRQML